MTYGSAMRSSPCTRSRRPARWAAGRPSESALLLALTACGAPAGAGPGADGEWRLGRPIVFTGACDASGAADLGGGRIAVADDEDNNLRVYDLSAGGPPIEMIETSSRLADARGKHPEMDLEAAATVGSRIYWIASHSRKKSGKRAGSRLRLFATDLEQQGGRATLVIAGRPYEALLRDLLGAPALARYDLAGAAARAPSWPGGLNIEGLTDLPATGHLLLGFRSPAPRGRTLVVPIRNPAAMVERGEPADLGPATELDLGGRGVRSLVSWRGAIWIVAGSPSGRAESRLYRWAGPGAPVWVESVRFGALNPEALAEVTVGGRNGLLVLSDDGERLMGGRPCKHLDRDADKQFRGLWLEKPGEVGGQAAARGSEGGSRRRPSAI
jgi:hypothetical protein